MPGLLEVKNLETQFSTKGGVVRAVDGVSWDVNPGETVALVGESGCGKSVSALTVMRLVSAPAGRIVGGQILFKGRDLLTLTEEEMRRVRGREIAMIFQEPMTSLNPVLTIGRQLTEPLEIHWDSAPGPLAPAPWSCSPWSASRTRRAASASIPHQFSGGMRQRIMIAMALACEPALILADEPTTALDVTIQAQILELMKDLSRRMGVAMLMITHNLGVVARYADRVNVMYAGTHRRAGDGARDLREPAPPLHPRAAALGAAAGRAEPREARADPRPAARPVAAAPRLRLRAALPLRDRAVPGGAPARGGGARPPQRVLGRQHAGENGRRMSAEPAVSHAGPASRRPAQARRSSSRSGTSSSTSPSAAGSSAATPR